jgi:hypothetical protein
MSSNPIVCDRIKLRLGKNKKNSRVLKYQVKKQLDLNFVNAIDSPNINVSMTSTNADDTEDVVDYNFKSLSRIPEEYILANSLEELESSIITILHKPDVRQMLSVIIGDEISNRISRGDIAIRIDNTSYNKNGIIGVSNNNTSPEVQIQPQPDAQAQSQPLTEPTQ